MNSIEIQRSKQQLKMLNKFFGKHLPDQHADTSELAEQYQSADAAAKRLAERQKTLRKLMQEKEDDAFAESHAASEKTFSHYASVIERNADAVAKALDRMQRASETGFRNSGQVLAQNAGLDAAAQKIQTLRAALEELGEYQLLDEEQQERFEDMRAQLEQSEKALDTNAKLIRQERNIRLIASVLKPRFAEHVLTGFGIRIELLVEIVQILAERLPAAVCCGISDGDRVAVRRCAGCGNAVLCQRCRRALIGPCIALIRKHIGTGCFPDLRAECCSRDRCRSDAAAADTSEVQQAPRCGFCACRSRLPDHEIRRPALSAQPAAACPALRE